MANDTHNILDSVRGILVPIHRAGNPFIAAFAVATLILFWIWSPLGWLGTVLTIWCMYFFRDPPRTTPTRKGLIVSPADGVVQMVVEAAPPPELDMGDEPRTRISIFMNVFSVHVNRIPADGEITGLYYHPGKFLNADLDKASLDNERQCLRMRMTTGQDIAFVQIAGLIARRIICDVLEGQKVRAGERFGMIRFGSRVDVYLDHDIQPLVMAGQRAVAGETVLADASSDEEARTGEQR